MNETVAILVESPRDTASTGYVQRHIVEPLEALGIATRLISVLDAPPRNGKSATKTEIRGSTAMEPLRRYRYGLLVGNTALQLATGSAGISRRRGRPIQDGNSLWVPVNNPSIIKHDPNQEAVLFNDLRLIADILEFGGVPEETRLDIRVVMDREDFLEMLEDLSGTVSFDVETTCLNPFTAESKITALGLGTRNHQWILGFNQHDAPLTQEQVEKWGDELVAALGECILVAHNGKFDALWIWEHLGIRLYLDFDTMLAHYLLDENSRHGLKYLAQILLNAPDWEVSLDVKKGAGSFLEQAKYLAHDVFYTRELRWELGRRLKEDLEVKRVFDHLLMPVANLFVEVEYDGVWIDLDRFGDAETVLREQYDEALASLQQWEPRGLTDARGRPVDFNWGSTKQLSELLYDQLKLPVIERTAAGGRSCSESVLKRLNHPMVTDLLGFREAKQKLSFFIDGWKPHLHKRPDGYYLHPSFKLHGTVTGRLSCENPNLQQVPRDPRIRSLISAPDGWTLLECDLSQVELRVAAELSGEEAMVQAFIEGIDIHWLTALGEIERGGGLKDLVLKTARIHTGDNSLSYAQCFPVILRMGHEAAEEIDRGWKEYRKKAKAVNFGYLYGMWWKKFKDYARDSYGVIITDEEAEASRNSFFERYPGLVDWHLRQKRFVRRHGYVPSLVGRKRRLPDARNASQDPAAQSARKAAERQSINSPVQSYASDHNLMSALQLRKEYSRRHVRICGAVHDAILVRVKNEFVEEVTIRLLEIMRRPELLDLFHVELQVPIEADGDIGPWGKGVSLAKWKEARGG